MLDFNNLKQALKDGIYLLITTSEWFYAKDGQSYKAVWGKCFIYSDKEVLGFANARGSNWLLRVGDGTSAMFIMGCQIHYAQFCENKPSGTHVLCIN